MKNILHRCVAVVLVMVLTFNFSLFERRALANPIIIPIAESVLLPLLGGALIGAGMTFDTDADYNSALKFAMRDRTLYALITASVVYKTVITDHLTGATEKIAQGLEFTKQTFVNLQNAIKARFSSSAQVDTASTNTVSLGSVEHPVSYYGGAPMLMNWNTDYYYNKQYGSYTSPPSEYTPKRLSAVSNFESLRPYSLGLSVNNSIGGYKFNAYKNNYSCWWYVNYSLLGGGGSSTSYVELNPSVGYEQSGVLYNDGFLCYVNRPNGIYMGFAYLGVGSTNYYSRETFVYSGVQLLYQLTTTNVPDTQLETYGFNSALAPANVFTDTPEYEAIINDIASLKGSSITDDDKIFVSPVVAPANQQRQDVIAVNPQVVIPDIENPSPPDIPVLPDNASIFDWLNSFWVKLGAMLTSLMTHITASTTATIDSNTETLADAIGNIISSNTTRVITETKAANVTLADSIVGTGTVNLNVFKVNGAKLLTVFPFCIPFDFVNAINGLATSPRVPYYSIDFTGTVLGNYKWELDMVQFEPIARVVRWTVWISFAVGLMLITRKFIKW